MSKRARQHIRNIQTAFGGDDAYRDYAWNVRHALTCWENENRLAAWQKRMQDFRKTGAVA